METDSPYGPTRYYNIEYDDGDELDGIADWYMFPKEDFLLIEKNGGEDCWSTSSHCRCVFIEHDNDYDEWPRLVGWYVAVIDGKECQFPRLSGAIQAYDYHIIEQKGMGTKRSELLEPDKYGWLLQDYDIDDGIDDRDDSSWDGAIELSNSQNDEFLPSNGMIHQSFPESDCKDLTEDNGAEDGDRVGGDGNNKSIVQGGTRTSSSGRIKKEHAAMHMGGNRRKLSKYLGSGRSGTGKSSYRGVHWQKNRKKWMSRYSLAHIGKKHINLGAFLNENMLHWPLMPKLESSRGDLMNI